MGMFTIKNEKKATPVVSGGMFTVKSTKPTTPVKKTAIQLAFQEGIKWSRGISAIQSQLQQERDQANVFQKGISFVQDVTKPPVIGQIFEGANQLYEKGKSFIKSHYESAKKEPIAVAGGVGEGLIKLGGEVVGALQKGFENRTILGVEGFGIKTPKIPEKWDMSTQMKALEKYDDEALKDMGIDKQRAFEVGRFLSMFPVYAFGGAAAKLTIGSKILIPAAVKFAPKALKFMPTINNSIGFLGIGQLEYDKEEETRVDRLKSDLVMIAMFETFLRTGGAIAKGISKSTKGLISKFLNKTSKNIKSKKGAEIGELEGEVKVIKDAIEKDTGQQAEITLANKMVKASDSQIARVNKKPLELKLETKQTVKTTDELLTYIDRQGFRTPEQIAKLRADIKANGIKYPVEMTLRKDGTYIIDDGTHRIQIAKDLGIKKLPVKLRTEVEVKPNVGQPTLSVTKPKVVKPKTVSVPRKQLPVGEGKEKLSRLEARVTESLEKTPEEVKKKLGTATFKQMNNKEQIQKAVKYVNENPDEAMAVLRGDVEAPKGILRNSIYVAMENTAKGDVALARRLASLESTRGGQEIEILKEIDKASPVKIMSDLINVRADASKIKLKGKPIQQATKETVGQIKKRVKVPDKYDWNKFIEGIQC